MQQELVDLRKSLLVYCENDGLHIAGMRNKLKLNNSTHETRPFPGRMVFFQSDIPPKVLVINRMRLSLTGWMKSLYFHMNI